MRFKFRRKSSIKEQILSQLLDAYANTLRVLKQIKTHNQPGSALFLPPTATPGNLGDEAMLAAAMKFVSDRDIKRIGIVILKSSCYWENLNLVTDRINLRDYFVHHSWKDRFRFVKAVSLGSISVLQIASGR